MTHGITRGPEGRLAVHRTVPISQPRDLNTLLFRFLLDKKICELGYVLDTDPRGIRYALPAQYHDLRKG